MKPRAFAPALTLLALAASLPAVAESEPWLVRDNLTDGWFGLAEPLAARGIDFDLSTTAYYAGLLSGTGDQDFEWGGRADAFLKVDTGKLGLWDGGGFHAHLESRFGDSADRATPRSGGIWPPNTGVVLPLGHPEEVFASSIYYSHRFPSKTSPLIGKINAVDLLATDPFFGGWARDRCTNVAFVAPPSGVVPPTIMGAVLSQKLDDFTLSFMAFDPEGWTGDYWIAYYNLSDDLQSAVAGALPLNDEQGVEVFYNFALTGWQRLTADLQWIDPARARFADAWVAGLRASVNL